MTRKQISSGSKFEAEIGYSRAIVDGDWIWVSGTTGFNYETMTISDSVTEQAEQTIKNIKAAMEKAGFSLSDVVRATTLPRWQGLRALLAGAPPHFGDIRPASTATIPVALSTAHEHRDPSDRQARHRPRPSRPRSCPCERSVV